MNIGIDITTAGSIRGPGRVTRELIRSLSKLESEDRFFCYTPLDLQPMSLPQNFIVRHIPRHHGLPWLNFSLPVAAIRDGVEVMLFPGNDCWVLPFRKSVVIVLDIAQRTHLRGDIKSLDRLQNDVQMTMLPLTASRIVAISRYTASQLVGLKPSLEGRISVSYLGVKGALRKGLSSKKKAGDYILFVSGFDKRKNVEGLLRAYKSLRDKGRKERLLLKGVVETGVGYYQDVPALVRQHGLESSVDVDTSYADEDRLASLYRNASVLVVPSFIEGFGLPVLEAMACGCPVACSNAASLPEVGGDAALYFDPHQPEQMAEAMMRILTEPGLRRQMVRKGYENVKRFSWEKMAREIMEILRSVAGAGQTARG